jgi:type II secretory pathway pseudopilin PulG
MIKVAFPAVRGQTRVIPESTGRVSPPPFRTPASVGAPPDPPHPADPLPAERTPFPVGNVKIAPPLAIHPIAPGFTLIELAIVLFVVTLLLGGVLTPLGQQINERQTGETRRVMEIARTALVGYALAHQEVLGPESLPCPDLRVTGQTGVANDGQEDRLSDGHCVDQVGNLPWLTLGLTESDAWGNRLGYAVSPDWSGRHGTSDAHPHICRDIACDHPMTAAAILISHGRNGFGATNVSGGINLRPTSPEEIENVDGDLRFILHAPRAGDRPGGEFDDLLLPLSPHWLRGRLCDPPSLCRSPTTP